MVVLMAVLVLLRLGWLPVRTLEVWETEIVFVCADE